MARLNNILFRNIHTVGKTVTKKKEWLTKVWLEECGTKEGHKSSFKVPGNVVSLPPVIDFWKILNIHILNTLSLVW